MQRETKTLKIAEIKPYERNPRKNDKAVDGVISSIKECGYISPIIVDENNIVLSGHTRLKAIQRLKWEEVEVVQITGLTEEQKKKFRLLDNKTNELAEWDFDMLEQELNGLTFELDWDWGIDKNISDYTEIKETTYEEPKEKSITCPYCNKEIKL